MNELVRAKNVPARQCLENAAEDRFVKAELLLDGFCREPYLPTNMALIRRDTALDERKLNPIGVIEHQPVEIGSREELAALTGDPEILYSPREIKRHRGPTASGKAPLGVHFRFRLGHSPTRLAARLSRRPCSRRPDCRSIVTRRTLAHQRITSGRVVRRSWYPADEVQTFSHTSENS